MIEESEWLRSRAVLELGWSRQARSVNFPARLRNGLQNGFITGRARVAELTSIEPFRKTTHKENWTVPKEAWLGSNDNSVLNLAADEYTTRDRGTGYSRIGLSGLSFNKAELIEFVDLKKELHEAPVDQQDPQSTLRTSTESPSNAGARPKADDWSKFAAALVAIHEERSISLDETESEVWNRVKQHLYDRGHACLSIDTVRPALRRAKAWANGKPFVDDTDTPKDEHA